MIDMISSIKKKLKKNKIIFTGYVKIKLFFVRSLVKLSPYIATKYLYRKNTGKKLNLKNPTDFNEKIQWLKLYWQHPLVVRCGDKYEVRNYAIESGCSEALIPSYGIYEDANDIVWEALPGKFALKVTNGCGFNIICKNKEKLNKKRTERQLNKWLRTDYGLKIAELHYSKMTPRIICEEFIETKKDIPPVDYKIYCFNGVPEYVLVTPERATEFKRFFFDLNWEKIDFEKKSTTKQNETFEKPDSFDDMIYYAKILAKPFPFVRVDFYDYNGKAILGEMTFTPAAGMATHYKEEFLLKLGEKIVLPKKIINGDKL